jgi:hypothetical protein
VWKWNGFVGGCDFLPQADYPASNELPVFYGWLPDTSTAVAELEEWRTSSSHTVAHEMTHLAVAAERFANGISTNESAWLEEARADVVAELYQRQVCGFGPRKALNDSLIAGCAQALGKSGAPQQLFPQLDRLAEYYAASDTLSALGPVNSNDESFYGSGWSLLRWALDYSAASDGNILCATVLDSTLTGIRSLERQTGQNLQTLLIGWAIAIAFDGNAVLSRRLGLSQIPSWMLEDVMRPRLGGFPVHLSETSLDSWILTVPGLQTGSAKILRLTGAAGLSPILSLTAPGGGSPDRSLRLAVVRLH